MKLFKTRLRVLTVLFLLAVVLISGCSKNGGGVTVLEGNGDGKEGSVDEKTDLKDDLDQLLETATTCLDKKRAFGGELARSKGDLEKFSDDMNRLVRDIKVAKHSGEQSKVDELEGELVELSDVRQELKAKIEFLERELTDFDC